MKRKYIERHQSPEQRVIQQCRVIDDSCKFLAERIGYTIMDLYQCDPSARQALCGVSVESLMELAVRRIDGLRSDDPNSAPSLEALARAAMRND